MSHKQVVGNFGESLAVEYLEKRGYEVFKRNIQTSYKELDVIARFKGFTIFIEVKTRTNLRFGSAEDAMSQRKLYHFKKAVMFYCTKYYVDLNCIRLDFIAIDIDKKRSSAKIKHFRDIA